MFALDRTGNLEEVAQLEEMAYCEKASGLVQKGNIVDDSAEAFGVDDLAGHTHVCAALKNRAFVEVGAEWDFWHIVNGEDKLLVQDSAFLAGADFTHADDRLGCCTVQALKYPLHA